MLIIAKMRPSEAPDYVVRDIQEHDSLPPPSPETDLLVDITSIVPRPDMGWAYDAITGDFTSPRLATNNLVMAKEKRVLELNRQFNFEWSKGVTSGRVVLDLSPDNIAYLLAADNASVNTLYVVNNVSSIVVFDSIAPAAVAGTVLARRTTMYDNYRSIKDTIDVQLAINAVENVDITTGW